MGKDDGISFNGWLNSTFDHGIYFGNGAGFTFKDNISLRKNPIVIKFI